MRAQSLAMFLALPLLSAAASRADIVVAVIDFDNVSGEYLADIGPAAHEVMNGFLVGLPGVQVVTRDKLRTVMGEQNLNWSGFVGNRAKSSEIGNLLGADYALTGSVVQYSTERRPFSGYGVNTLTVFHRMRISLQIADLGSSELKFSKTYSLEVKDLYLDASSAPYRAEGRERELLAQLIEQASGDIQQALGRVTGRAAPAAFRIAVVTDPSGADIEVNGAYIGSTPAEVELEEGLQLVRLSRQGYEVWEKKVKVNEGLRISVVLAPLPPEQKVIIENRGE